MTLTLGEILGGSVVLDNSVHQVREGSFMSGYQRKQIKIYNGNGGSSQYRAWGFLSTISSEIARLLQSDDGASFVVFNGRDYEHNTDDTLLRMGGGMDFNDFTFTTGNLIGCVNGSYDGYPFTLRVSSRFGDEFLKFIIAEADGFVEVTDHGGMEKGGYDWLLVYLWLIKLKKAYRLGLPKAYESRTEKLVSVRGRLDAIDYALHSHIAKYRCTFREHCYNNETTRLIARTLQHLDSTSDFRAPHRLNQTFQFAIEGEHRSLQELLATKPVRNPYYSDYLPVVSLAKLILRNELSDFGETSPTNALLFDVSMLFEYFIRKLLQRNGARFHPKDDRRWSIPSGLIQGYSRRKLIPDLIFDIDDSTFVFDVKYKAFDFKYGVSREDLFQIHTYLGQVSNEQPVAGCGFIYPIKESRWEANGLDAWEGIYSDTITQAGIPIPFHVVFLKIPEQGEIPLDEWPSRFRQSFNSQTEAFIRALWIRLEPIRQNFEHPLARSRESKQPFGQNIN
jgi:5-methylcytosine-specific restriction enzyme subunit McrC